MKQVKSETDQIIRQAIRDIPDFPKSGIIFKDITTALKQPEIIQLIVDAMYEEYKGKGITKVVGIESRGFIIAGALAYKLNAGFVPVRKPGKLPADVYTQTYALEYGTDSLQIHKDALTTDDVVLLHDDVLATGGSANAAIELIKQCGCFNVQSNFLIELSFLNGRDKLPTSMSVTSLLKY